MLQVLRSNSRGLELSIISYNAVAHSCARAAAGAPPDRIFLRDFGGGTHTKMGDVGVGAKTPDRGRGEWGHLDHLTPKKKGEG